MKLRHLRYTDDIYPICGANPKEKSVHFSKARKTDCALCRKIYRINLRAERNPR